MGNGQSFFVMQGEILNKAGVEHGFADLYELASCIADGIVHRAPRAPIYLCARFGAVAIETAHQLQRRNVEIGALLILDNVAPALLEAGAGSSVIRRIVLGPFRMILRVPANIGLADWLLRKPEDRTSTIKRRNPFNIINSELSRDYRADRFDGRVILIRSQDFSERKSKARHLEGWRRISSEFETYTVPGTHHTMFEPPNVGRLSALIQDIVAGSEAHELASTYGGC
jgi:thioesterase domain-containing protein